MGEAIVDLVQQLGDVETEIEMKIVRTIVIACSLILVVGLRPSQAVFADGPALSTTDLNSEGTTANSLAQALVGSGVTISNASYSGANVAAGTFTTPGSTDNNGIVGFNSGVILSTGCVSNVIGPNNSPSATCQNGTAGDNQLTALAGVQTYDASILQFDFVPNADKVFFSYVFASEEYNEYVGSQFNDTFAFYINGVNCAVLPDNSPVNINSVNLNKNSDLFVNNDVFDAQHPPTTVLNTQMDGLTKVLTCAASVNKNATNHIKLAIADAGDSQYDSNVFLQAGSFSTTPPTNTPPTANAGGPYAGLLASNIPLSGATASDGDGDTLTYAWSMKSGPTGASCTFSNSAALNPTVNCTKLGPYVLELSVNDGTNPAVTSDANLMVFTYPTTGRFVLGAGAVTTALAALTPAAATVTFWSPIWPRLNALVNVPLSTAPLSFRGLAKSTSSSPPTCGGTWTGTTSTTTAAPATVPTYMGVLVSSNITLAGSTLTGDIKSIVVVKTNPGYSNAPGRSGTGTIVGVFCGP